LTISREATGAVNGRGHFPAMGLARILLVKAMFASQYGKICDSSPLNTGIQCCVSMIFSENEITFPDHAAK
jgi:hypothetical protein